MMLTYTRLKKSDFAQIKPQERQKIDVAGLLALEDVLLDTDARTYRNKDGEIVFIGGIVKRWENHAQIWSILSSLASPHMLQLTREVRKWIDSYSEMYRRIECQVQEDFPNAHKWMRLLRFRLDGVLPFFFMNGQSAYIYSRINKNG